MDIFLLKVDHLKTIHVAQNCLFIPILDELSTRGINKSDLIKRSGLSKFKYEDTDSYVPLDTYYNLLVEIQYLGIYKAFSPILYL